MNKMIRCGFGIIVAPAVVAAWTGPALAQTPAALHPTFVKTIVPVKTIPLRDMRNLDLPPIMRRIVGNRHLTEQQLAQLRARLVRSGHLKATDRKSMARFGRTAPVGRPVPGVRDPAMQRQIVRRQPFATGVGFPGLGFSGGQEVYAAPPDTNIAVGGQYIVEITNLYADPLFATFAAWDKQGNPYLGPIALATLWSSGGCSIAGGGAGIVLYDQYAQRWILSQLNGSYSGICVAVSATADPGGPWYLYDFLIDSGDEGFADQPKMGIWPAIDADRDAYLVTNNQYADFGDFLRVNFVALERPAMLAGDPAQEIVIDGVPDDQGGLDRSVLPASADGAGMPPANDPGIFLGYASPYLFDTSDYALEMWRMTVDWSNPGNSTLSGPTAIAVEPFNDGICNLTLACIPQPRPGNYLDALGDRLMYRLAYRNFGDHQALVVNHTVGTGGAPAQPPAGIRWYELDAPAGATDAADWTVSQQGTYLPADGSSRWMGSIAMDHTGNIALGYSLSSPSVYPSVVVTGQNVGAPPGLMDAGETTLVAGGGSQVETGDRWGDYSSMAIDPSDDCTFWYAQEYMSQSLIFAWSTFIGSFKFDNCSLGPTGAVEGIISDAGTGDPIEGATVTLAPVGAQAKSGSDGHYSLTNAPGNYIVAACAFGYECSPDTPVTITDGGDTALPLALDAAPTVMLQGRITDAGHGYPLYAELKIKAYETTVANVWSNVVNGRYRVALPADTTYAITVIPYVAGFIEGTASLTPSADTVHNFVLSAAASCLAPGYDYAGGVVETFEGADFPPPGWTMVNQNSIAWRKNTEWCPGPVGTGDGNYTNGSGIAADVDDYAAQLCESDYSPYDTSLITPPIPVNSLDGTTVTWSENFQVYEGNEALDFDISTDGGSNWVNVQRQTASCGSYYSTPGCEQSVDLGSFLPQSGDFQLRWRYHAPIGGGTYAEIDDLVIGDPQCTPISGGLVSAVVTDANTGKTLTGVTIADENGASAETAANPNGGPAGAILFEPSGRHTLTATKTNYQDAIGSINVGDGTDKVKLFRLNAGRLAARPHKFTVNVPAGKITTLTLRIGNTGTAPVDWALRGFNGAPPPAMRHGPFAPVPHYPAGRALDTLAYCGGANGCPRDDKSGTPPAPPPRHHPGPRVAGDVISFFDGGLEFPYGLGYARNADNLWVGDISSGNTGGDDKDHQFLPDGTPTGLTMGTPLGTFGFFAADMSFDDATGMFWQLSVDEPDGLTSHIWEMNPDGSGLTGRNIRVPSPQSERGLAYDPISDTWYTGDFNSQTIYHFDSSGTLLDSKHIANLYIVGMTYNSGTGHLFVTTSGGLVPTVFVLDAHNNYAIVRSFNIPDLGVFAADVGAGLDYDCGGALWLTDFFLYRTYQVESGETGWCDYRNVPWLSFNPAAGALGPRKSATTVVTIDGRGQTPGTQNIATARLTGNAPYGNVDIRLTINWTGGAAGEP